MNNLLKDRTIGFYVGCVSAILPLVTGVVLLVYSNSVADVYLTAPVFLLVGAVVSGIALVGNIHFLLVVPGVCYIAAFALYLSSQLGNISAKVSANGVGDTGTSLNMLTVFLVLMLVATVLSVAACFMKQKRV